MYRFLLSVAAIALFTVMYSCKKSNDAPSNARTVQNISGYYNYTGLSYTQGSVTISAFDSLDVCEKDNLLQFNTNLTYNFIDTGVVCSPSESGSGTWNLSAKGDSLILDSDPAFIKSWDGKTLVVVATVQSVPTLITATTTLVKK
jgi:hypothetical protein